jgi:hypothetical protein
MKEVLAKVYETKQSGRKSTELSELKTDFLMHFLTLKKLNRHSGPKLKILSKKQSPSQQIISPMNRKKRQFF